MGYQLRREVRDMLPPGVLTHKEARLVLELADACNDTTRRGWPGVEWLADAADLGTAKKAGEALAAVARKWVELREEIGKDKNGAPVYTHPKRRTSYRFPTRGELLSREVALGKGVGMLPQIGGPSGPERSPKTGDQVQGWSPKTGDLRSPKTGEHSAEMVPQNRGPFSSKISTSSSSSADEDESGENLTNTTVGAIAQALALTPADALAVWQRITADTTVRSPAKFVTALIRNGDIRRYLPQPPPAAPSVQPCDYTEDPQAPGRCARCALARTNRRHQEAA